MDDERDHVLCQRPQPTTKLQRSEAITMVPVWWLHGTTRNHSVSGRAIFGERERGTVSFAEDSQRRISACVLETNLRNNDAYQHKVCIFLHEKQNP